MQFSGTDVIRICGGPCPYFERIDVDAMITLLGPDGDLWDARPPCPLCDERNHFMASPGPGTPKRPLLSPPNGPNPPRPPGGWPPWPPVAALDRPAHVSLGVAMATYTLVITGHEDGHQHTALADFPSDAVAIADVKGVLTAEHSSIAVARGAGDDLAFMGAWDWCDGAPRWTPDE